MDVRIHCVGLLAGVLLAAPVDAWVDGFAPSTPQELARHWGIGCGPGYHAMPCGPIAGRHYRTVTGVAPPRGGLFVGMVPQPGPSAAGPYGVPPNSTGAVPAFSAAGIPTPAVPHSHVSVPADAPLGVALPWDAPPSARPREELLPTPATRENVPQRPGTYPDVPADALLPFPEPPQIGNAAAPAQGPNGQTEGPVLEPARPQTSDVPVQRLSDWMAQRQSEQERHERGTSDRLPTPNGVLLLNELPVIENWPESR